MPRGKIILSKMGSEIGDPKNVNAAGYNKGKNCFTE